MKTAIGVLVGGVLLSAWPVSAQPLSGSYRIGGTTPDYATCEDAALDVVARGIIGDVTFVLRPGVYEAATPGGTVLPILAQIPGASSSSTVTFLPDGLQGGTVDNVILRVRADAALATNPLLADIRSDYVRLTDLTFAFEDTSVVGRLPEYLVEFRADVGNAEMNGAEAHRCRFFVKSTNGWAHAAIRIEGHNRDTKLRFNEIDGGADGISFSNHYSYSPEVFGNTLTGMRDWITGGSANVGYGIILGAVVDGVIARNRLDYSGGASGSEGIYMGSVQNLTLDGNTIIGPASGGGVGPNDTFFAVRVQASGGLPNPGGRITNNAITHSRASRTRGLQIAHNGLVIAHNTVINGPRGVGSYSGALYLEGTDCRVENNILIERSTNPTFALAMLLADTTGNVIDYNDLYSSGGLLVYAGPTPYANLAAWQTTGFDLNSVSLQPSFVDIKSDLHLAGCSVFDPALRGIGIAEATEDFDNESRDPTSPFMGADEAGGLLPAYFDPPLDYRTGSSSWQMAAGDLDVDGRPDLVVTNSPFNGGSNDLTLLYNDGNGAFPGILHLWTANQPNLVRVDHLNGDVYPDILVSSETADSLLLRINIGDGTFSAPILVDAKPAITDFEIADYDADGDNDIIMLVSPSADSGYVNIRIDDSGFFDWNNVAAAGWHLDDLAIADFDRDGFLDLAVVDNTTTHSVSILRNLGVYSPGVSKGFAAPVTYYENVRSTATVSNLMVGDFDGDLYPDLILGDALGLENLVLLRNQGDGTLAPREIVSVDPTRTYRVSSAFDYEGDGDLDIVTANNSLDLHLLLNDGFANFERKDICAEGPLLLDNVPQVLIAAHLDADARLDLAVLHIADTVQVLRNLDYSPVGVGGADAGARTLVLYQNVPNPVRTGTTISFRLPRAMEVRLDVYDVAGRRVETLIEGPMPPGLHAVRWDGAGVSSGVYFYRLQGEGLRESRKLTYVR